MTTTQLHYTDTHFIALKNQIVVICTLLLCMPYVY